MEKTRKEPKTPNAYAIVFTILILAAMATYIVPAGIYDTIINEAGVSVIDPNSFHYVENVPITLWGFLNTIYNGLVRQAGVIFYIFLLGGYFQVILDTGAIDALISLIIKKFGNKAIYSIPVIMLMMSILGNVGVLVNPVVAMIPVGLLIAKRLKLDQIAAVGIIFCAAYQGFATTMVGAPTLQYAQQLAEIPILSGIGFRTVVWLVMYLATTWYVMRYAKKLMKDRSVSYMGDESFDAKEVPEITFTTRHLLILLTFGAGFSYYTYGALKYTWGTAYMTGIMLAVTLVTAVIAKMNVDTLIKSFIKGCNIMTYGCMLIGLAVGVATILTDGQIVYTIVHALSLPLQYLPTWCQGISMYIMNTIFNFFVSSGSSQAAIVMPVMAPLADILGISRQIAICAYQYGDGLSNLIFPTNGTLMACIGVAGVPFHKWMKFMVPLFCLWSVVIMICLTAGVLLGVS